MYFDGIAFPAGSYYTMKMLTNCYVASVNPEFGTTLARRLNQNRVCAVLPAVEPYCNLVLQGRSTTFELGLIKRHSMITRKEN